MWPAQSWTPDGGASSSDPLRQDSNQDGIEEENFRILAAPLLTPGSVPLAPSNSTIDSIDFSELMTKPEKIIESHGAQDWDTIFYGLYNLQSVEIANPSTCFQSEANPTTLTSLSVPNPIPQPRNPSSKKSKLLHGKIF